MFTDVVTPHSRRVMSLYGLTFWRLVYAAQPSYRLARENTGPEPLPHRGAGRVRRDRGVFAGVGYLMSQTVAQLYPARVQADGTIWYRAADLSGQLADGWTATLAYAHPSYRDDDAPEPVGIATSGPLTAEQPLGGVPAAGADWGDVGEELTTKLDAISARARVDPEAERAALDKLALIERAATTTEENTVPRSAPTALTDDFTDYVAPRFTQWMRYPLPPEPDRPASKFNGWGWYQLPAPTTGRPAGFPRATTIADTLDDTYGLSRWKRRETAMRIYQLATMDPATVVWSDDTGQTTAGDCLGNLVDAMNGTKVTGIDTVLDVIDNIMGGAEARELGECAHAWLGAINAGTQLLKDVPDVVRPHVTYGLKVLAHRGIVVLPEYTERTVLNDQGEETVAGKIDGIGRLLTTDELVLLDVKTNKDLQYSWLSYGVQVGGVYGWATKVLSADGASWEPMPAIREEFAVLLHIPSNQPERAAAITIDRQWGGEVMVTSLEVRRRRKEAKVEVPKHAIPVPSPEAIRYCEARNALSAITTAAEGQAVYETYADIFDDDLGAFAEKIAGLL